MPNNSLNSLLKRALLGALVLFGIAVLLQASVEIVAQIWPWLVIMVLIGAAVVGIVIALRRWYDQNQW
jgi:hypothetical protein